MPCGWEQLFGSASGTATFSRKFHRPSNLEPHERVLIVLTGVGGEGTLSLNDKPLSQFAATDSTVEADATSELRPFNVLAVQITFDPAARVAGGLFAPVVLEIRGNS